MRVYLVGFMAAGKTTAGRHLARECGWPFVDLDAEIERQAGAPVSEIFEVSGEAEFRRLERERLRASRGLRDAVVATGGGVFDDPGNREWIGRHGVSVWLNVPFETIEARVSARGRARRPLFQDRDRAQALYRARLRAYREAEIEVRVSADDVAVDVARRIRRGLRERSSCDI